VRAFFEAPTVRQLAQRMTRDLHAKLQRYDLLPDSQEVT
jgi:hypothetical protein